LSTVASNTLGVGTYNLVVQYAKDNYTTATKSITVVVTSADYTTTVD